MVFLKTAWPSSFMQPPAPLGKDNASLCGVIHSRYKRVRQRTLEALASLFVQEKSDSCICSFKPATLFFSSASSNRDTLTASDLLRIVEAKQKGSRKGCVTF
jgi:hypothetical protein